MPISPTKKGFSLVYTVLAFASYGLNTGTCDVMKITIQFYSLQEVTIACDLLLAKCRTYLYGGISHKRKIDGIITDITDWILDLDKQGKLPYLVVDVCGLHVFLS